MATVGYRESTDSTVVRQIRVDTPNRTSYGVRVTAEKGTVSNVKVFSDYVTFDVTGVVVGSQSWTVYDEETEHRSMTYSNSSPPAPSCASLPGWSLVGSYTWSTASRTCTYSRVVRVPRVVSINIYEASGSVSYDSTPNSFSGRVFTYEQFSVSGGAKGELVGSVKAVYGSFPDDGVHWDGYWYLREALPMIEVIVGSERRQVVDIGLMVGGVVRRVVDVGIFIDGVEKRVR